MDEREVHEKANEVLAFWFGLTTEQHFAKDEALDRAIARRFAGLVEQVRDSNAEEWRDDPDPLLAAIIVLDQFARNIYRDDARAFAGDDLSTSLSLLAIERGWELRYPPERRVFLFMPLMHAEDVPIQQLSLEKFAQEGLEDNYRYAREHAEVIDRFGRFPSRNAALGRVSTPEEETYLSRPDAGW